MQWYEVENIREIDSPALLVYPDRVRQNIELAKAFVAGQTSRLRPHIKTHKCDYIVGLLREAGITKVKCATIPEAELALTESITDVLLAYQPAGPKIDRLIELKKRFKHATLSCLIDNAQTAADLSHACLNAGVKGSCFIDINVGQNRTGIEKNKFEALLTFCHSLTGIEVIGMHLYDGHIDDESFTVRKQKADEIIDFVSALKEELPANFKVVIGGTTTFPVYAKIEGLECSPGTFIYWDAGYERAYKEQNFQIGALLVSRVVSKISNKLLCLDLGYKSISSENNLDNRLSFLGREAKIVKQYEEHLVVEIKDCDNHAIGEVWYISPVHICPTVALYDCIYLIEKHQFISTQQIAARQRMITV